MRISFISSSLCPALPSLHFPVLSRSLLRRYRREWKEEGEVTKRKCFNLSSSVPHSSALFPWVPIPSHLSPQPSLRRLAPRFWLLLRQPTSSALLWWQIPGLCSWQCGALGWLPGCSTPHYFSHCNSFPCDWRQLGRQQTAGPALFGRYITTNMCALPHQKQVRC